MNAKEELKTMEKILQDEIEHIKTTIVTNTFLYETARRGFTILKPEQYQRKIDELKLEYKHLTGENYEVKQ